MDGIITRKFIQINVGPCRTLLQTVTCSSNISGYDPYLTITDSSYFANEIKYSSGFDMNIPAVITMICDSGTNKWVTFQNTYVNGVGFGGNDIFCFLRSTGIGEHILMLNKFTIAAGCTGCGALTIGDASTQYFISNGAVYLGYTTVGGICSANIYCYSFSDVITAYTDINNDLIANVVPVDAASSFSCIAGSYTNITSSKPFVYCGKAPFAHNHSPPCM